MPTYDALYDAKDRLRNWNLALFDNALFDKANLDVDVQKAVEKVEKDQGD
jgi:hypothetical protein